MLYQSNNQKRKWREKFTPETIEQYKLYLYIQEHFLPDCIKVEIESRNKLRVSDTKDEALIFEWKDKKGAIWYDDSESLNKKAEVTIKGL